MRRRGRPANSFDGIRRTTSGLCAIAAQRSPTDLSSRTATRRESDGSGRARRGLDDSNRTELGAGPFGPGTAGWSPTRWNPAIWKEKREEVDRRQCEEAKTMSQCHWPGRGLRVGCPGGSRRPPLVLGWAHLLGRDNDDGGRGAAGAGVAYRSDKGLLGPVQPPPADH